MEKLIFSVHPCILYNYIEYFCIINFSRQVAFELCDWASNSSQAVKTQIFQNILIHDTRIKVSI